MKRLTIIIIALLCFAGPAIGQGTSAISYPTATPVTTDHLLGIDNPGGTWSIARFSISDLIALIEANMDPPSGDMVYPAAGIAVSTGSAWGTSYTAGLGASNLVQLSASPGTPDGHKFLRDDGVWEHSPAFKEVYNFSGSTITQGTVVAITGSSGAWSLITPADKDTSLQADGIAVADILASTTGLIQLTGTMEGAWINTSGETAGAPIYLGDDGGYTTTAPTTGNVIFLGKIGVIAPTNGTLLLNLPSIVTSYNSLANKPVVVTAGGGTTFKIFSSSDCSAETGMAAGDLCFEPSP